MELGTAVLKPWLSPIRPSSKVKTMTEKHTRAASALTKTVALTGAALALLSACGEPKATPMNDEYAGNSGETEQSQEQQSGSSADSSGASSSSDSGSSDTTRKDTGNYKDGTYSVNGQYGPVGEDTIDAHVTVKDQNVTNVEIIGHPFTSISKQHQTDFANAINGVVDGKPLKGLKVDKVAGASWTSDAFNEVLDEVRNQASQ